MKYHRLKGEGECSGSSRSVQGAWYLEGPWRVMPYLLNIIQSCCEARWRASKVSEWSGGRQNFKCSGVMLPRDSVQDCHGALKPFWEGMRRAMAEVLLIMLRVVSMQTSLDMSSEFEKAPLSIHFQGECCLNCWWADIWYVPGQHLEHEEKVIPFPPVIARNVFNWSSIVNVLEYL